jgi:transposase-like protein
MPDSTPGCPHCGSTHLTPGTSSYEFQRREQPGSTETENALVATIQNYKCNGCGHAFAIRTEAEDADPG